MPSTTSIATSVRRATQAVGSEVHANQSLICGIVAVQVREVCMSKNLDKRKETKKKPQKSLEEKRAAKREKRESKGYR
jgi:hypothetical protein